MNEKFLRYYFKKELYVENPPLNMKDFIDFCNKRGVKLTQDKLEEFEKNGWFYPIFRVKDLRNKPRDIFISLDFHPQYHHDFDKLLKEKYIFLPQEYEFMEFSKFVDEKPKKRRFESFYSTFQIHHIIALLGYDPKNELNNLLFKPFQNHVRKLIDLLIATQIYAPYGRSNMRYFKPNYDDYHKKLNEYDLKEALSVIGAEEDDLYKCYAEICNELEDMLGSRFAIQLWENISWDKKDKCKGQTRLGIEYLQWAMMLKQCIEHHLGREIFDVDEIDMTWEDIKNTIPSEETGRSIRGCRNEDFTNEINGEYEFNNINKRLYYLANSLNLNYHPKVVVFVEGKTEEMMIPRFFEFYGTDCDKLGIEIVNVGGVSNFYGKKIKIRDENARKYVENIVSSYKHLINYNLHKWQALPYFIGDDENKLTELILNGRVFDLKELFEKFDGRNIKEIEKEYLEPGKEKYEKMIEEWSHVWKYDFELSNYEPEELQNAINEVCGTSFSLEKIKGIYKPAEKGKTRGLKSLGDAIESNKIRINEKAFENLVDYYNKTKDETVFNKEIFKVIDKIIDMAVYNPAPVNTRHSMRNVSELGTYLINGKDIFKRDEYELD